jgi:peptidoglycan/xylan/chitin deacetylase (PgdA/CDA1 family)
MTKLFGPLSLGAAAYFIARRTLKAFRDLGSKRYPQFIYKEVEAKDLGIPVFTYHSIARHNTPDSVTLIEFERHMRYLSENRYCALSADELYEHLVYGSPVPAKSIVITFDDGRSTLWTIAYPILKRYNLKAVSFIVPGTLTESEIRSNLNDYKAGKPISLDELLDADVSDTPAITWDEAKVMHASGIIDFQSHTLDHALIHYTPEIIDFISPTFRYGYNNYRVPTMRYGNVDCVNHRPRLGTPIYRCLSRMSAARRFFDDEELRNACTDYVERCGGHTFFEQSSWRAKMFEFVEAYRREHKLQEAFETVEEQTQAIRHSLARSKQLIEAHLSNHTVRHLCYPWHRYSMLAASLAREVGYVTAFIDINSQKPFPDQNNAYIAQTVVPINEYGDDPYQITRINVAAGEDPILSLPGKGRLTYIHRFAARLLKIPQWFERG